jgi:hypothetical protein
VQYGGLFAGADVVTNEKGPTTEEMEAMPVSELRLSMILLASIG